MKFKKIVLFFLVLSMLVCTCGCVSKFKHVECDGVSYDKGSYKDGTSYLSIAIVGFNYDKSNVIYIPPEIEGRRITALGSIYGWGASCNIYGPEKIYFPWTIEVSLIESISYNEGAEYIISASTQTIIDTCTYFMYVIPKCMYNDPIRTYPVRSVLSSIDIREYSNIIPANVAYFFNYEENPNEGYFFVDLLEESGKIIKPPYDPKREGYKFAGWYKEAECVNAWDFENDIVEINFDEEGERIYEEFCLYAKWEKK